MRNVERSFLWRLLDGSPTEWIWFAAAFLLVLLAIWMVVKVSAWMRGGDDTAVDDNVMLTQISDLRREGDLSETEYRSIKSRLVERLDQQEIEPTLSDEKEDTDD